MTVIQGDCLDVMRVMEENSIDFIVTDPPYGLHFMGKDWDGRIPAIEIWAEALRVAKPGTMLAAFGGSRTHHHLMCAIEGAGWEIRDVIMWIYGSGFPKSHNFGRKMGNEWKGYGTALKPAYEPIILAMKTVEGTFAQNAEKWGVAGINIDESRIGIEGGTARSHQVEYPKNENGTEDRTHWARTGHSVETNGLGRWPANLILDEEGGKMLGNMTGISISKSNSRHNKKRKGNSLGQEYARISYGHDDSGDASRFFYCAKASSSERNRGLEGMPFRNLAESNKWTDCDYRKGKEEVTAKGHQNNHPTVKPISLMKYIINLLAPPGNPVLLDPFAGSGSTLLAAKELGINVIGIEKEAEYCEIARKRIEYAEKIGEDKCMEFDFFKENVENEKKFCIMK